MPSAESRTKTFGRLLQFIALQLAARQRRRTVQLLRLKAVAWGVRGVRAARLAFLGYLGLQAVMGLFAIGVVLFHVGLFLYLPWPVHQRALCMVGLGGFYIVVFLAVLAYIAREQWWMQKSGMDKRVDEVLEESAPGKEGRP